MSEALKPITLIVIGLLLECDTKAENKTIISTGITANFFIFLPKEIEYILSHIKKSYAFVWGIDYLSHIIEIEVIILYAIGNVKKITYICYISFSNYLVIENRNSFSLSVIKLIKMS